MNPGAELRNELGRAVNALRSRQVRTSDAKEKKALAGILQRLNKPPATLDEADRLTIANTLNDGMNALEEAVAAVKHGPFDGYLSALEGLLDNLSGLSGAVHRLDALPPAPAIDSIAPESATTESSSAAPEANRWSTDAPDMSSGTDSISIQPPSRATDFAALKDEYAAWYAACTLRPERKGELDYCLKRLNQGQPTYQQVGAELNIPWAFIGITHGMESGFNFKGHLHNGDPLTARTVQVPKGRPATGNPPFTWSQSARDALIYKGYHQVADWSVPHMLYLFECYNGMGYRRRGVPTPYLWSFSSLYEKGKFIADGHYDPQAVSQQCGAALMLKAVLG
ncbi:MAG: hypothetical protein IPL29_08310 [Propionivibrio sp.]|uniref:hypothetical protein n=1 Tax=Propionivibrio sp. TaxID=2212460 RepID=UPI0025EC58B4|nr:hypothetical protein [Propionivibrio sp.]MBK7356636.1 hypothetical protein [Propionivibrio sp.]MBK8401049.1 hypothetical protein [Propionivibrio sp.]MBK8894334.1 hypothetical protein [Propionivibrio sp.]MBL0208862.1 hypothetical protein [Propionivibrio sp.]